MPEASSPRMRAAAVAPTAVAPHPTSPLTLAPDRHAPDRAAAGPRSIRLRGALSQFVHFGLVGGLAFVVDIGVYNLLRLTLLDDKPIGAKVISVAVATLVAWIGNRSLTFREQRGRPVLREAFLFAVMNVIGLGIAALCLYVSHYLLGFQSQLADNIAGNGVGLVLGMAFRFFAYRYVVFARETDSAPAPKTVAEDSPPSVRSSRDTHPLHPHAPHPNAS